MKTVPLHEYKYKKRIADNLEEMVNKRYIEISDDEYDRINNAIQSYSESIEEIYDNLQDVSFTEPQKTKLLADIEKLEADILALKQSALYTQENGLYFTDEDGNIGAKLDSNGFEAINIGGAIEGITGPKGDTGPTGPKGDTGDTGPQGADSEGNLTIIDY
jgi:hypothetical protein